MHWRAQGPLARDPAKTGKLICHSERSEEPTRILPAIQWMVTCRFYNRSFVPQDDKEKKENEECPYFLCSVNAGWLLKFCNDWCSTMSRPPGNSRFFSKMIFGSSGIWFRSYGGSAKMRSYCSVSSCRYFNTSALKVFIWVSLCWRAVSFK